MYEYFKLLIKIILALTSLICFTSPVQTFFNIALALILYLQSIYANNILLLVRSMNLIFASLKKRGLNFCILENLVKMPIQLCALKEKSLMYKVIFFLENFVIYNFTLRIRL